MLLALVLASALASKVRYKLSSSAKLKSKQWKMETFTFVLNGNEKFQLDWHFNWFIGDWLLNETSEEWKIQRNVKQKQKWRQKEINKYSMLEFQIKNEFELLHYFSPFWQILDFCWKCNFNQVPFYNKCGLLSLFVRLSVEVCVCGCVCVSVGATVGG